MAETGDLIKEFKEAKPPEKTVIIVGIIAVIGIAWYLYAKNKAGSTSPYETGTPASPGSQQAGYPAVGSAGTPVLPAGVNPLYDPNGNLIAFQNPGSNAGPPLSNGTQPTTIAQNPGPPLMGQPPNWYTALLGKIPYGAKITPGGIAPPGQRFWYGTNSFFYAPVGTSFQQGGAGRIWLNLPGKPANQQGTLITGQGMTPSTTMVAKVAAK